MKYVDTFSLYTTTLARCGQYNFRLNSLYDPNLTGTGHQPYGRDTLATLYNRYRVYKCSYVITGVSATNYTMKIGALPSNEVMALPNNFSEIQEKPRTKFIVQGTGAPQVLLKGSVYLPSLYGRTRAQMMADDRYQAQIDDNPAELAILNVFGGLIGDAAANDEIICTITMTFHAEFFDPKILSQS